MSQNRNIEDIQQENEALKREIAALRSQIDKMQENGKELLKQNSELQKQIMKISGKQNELKKLQSQKDQLFNIIINDLNNPASMIKSLVELLSSYDLSATEQQSIISDIVETTSKIVNISQQVTRVLALESTNLKLDFDKVQINMIIEDITRVSKVQADKKFIKIITDLDESIPEAIVDPQRYGEIIENLISNSIKYTPDGGTIRVRTYKSGDGVVSEISDNGDGLSEEEVRAAFQRGAFVGASSGREKSSGLGLWIIKKLVDAHNGRVWVKSAIGKGTMFSVSIPFEKE